VHAISRPCERSSRQPGRSGECILYASRCGACFLHSYKLAPGFLLLLASTRVSGQVRAPITPLALHAFVKAWSPPFDPEFWTDRSQGSRLSGPTIPTPPPGALDALGALSSNARARSLARALSPPLYCLCPLPLDRWSLSRRALSPTLPSLSIVGLSVSFALGLWRLPQLS